MLDHSLSNDIFPNSQSKPPLTQLEAIKNDFFYKTFEY